MNTRTVTSSVLVVIAALAAGCGKQQAVAAGNGTLTSAPGIRYEAHMNAGGVAPPGAPLHRTDSKATDAKAGGGLFSSMNCDGCHGGGATGWVGPSLVDGRWRYGGDDEEVYQSIFYGRPKGMPAYGGVLGADGVWMIVSYLKAQPVPGVVPTTNYEEIVKPPAPASTSAAPPAETPSEVHTADGSPRRACAIRLHCLPLGRQESRGSGIPRCGREVSRQHPLWSCSWRRR